MYPVIQNLDHDFERQEEKLRTTNAKAERIIIAWCISDSHLELVKECETARQIINKELLILKHNGNEKLETSFITFNLLENKMDLMQTEAKVK